MTVTASYILQQNDGDYNLSHFLKLTEKSKEEEG